MKALTVGGAMQDSIAIIDNEKIERMAMRNADTSFLLLEEGKKTEASEISTHCGGGAVNAAVSISRLGMDARTLIKLGKDYKAETIVSRLREEGIETKWVSHHKTAPTGSSVIIASHDRDAAIFTFRGANTQLKIRDLKNEAFDVDLVYISSLSNESADCFPTIVKKGRAHDAMIATNPGIRQLSSRTEAFFTTLKDIDLVSVNQREANALVPQLITSGNKENGVLSLKKGERAPELVSQGFSGGGFEITLAGFVKAMIKQGLTYMLITAGKQGAFLANSEYLYHCPALKRVKIAGTAGGGDAFASTLSAFLRLGHSPQKAMQAATLNAASVISYANTQSGLLPFDKLEERIAKHSDELKIREWAL